MCFYSVSPSCPRRPFTIVPEQSKSRQTAFLAYEAEPEGALHSNLCSVVGAGPSASTVLLYKPLPLGCASCECQPANKNPLHMTSSAVGQRCPPFVSFVDCIELHLARSGHSCAKITTDTCKCQSRLWQNIVLKRS